MKKLKIGLFIDEWFPNIDGVVVVVDNLVKNLSKYADVTLVIPYMGGKNIEFPCKTIEVDSIPVILADYRLALADIEYLKLKKIFKDIDIHSPFSIGKLGIKIARSKNIPVISTMHTRWEFEFEKYLKSKTLAKLCVKYLIKSYNQCDSSIALNKSLIKVYKDYGYKGDYTIINNGTDLEIVKDKKKALETVNKLFKLNKDDYVMLFVGRMVSFKNIFFILDTLRELKRRKFNFKMIYVGNGPDYNVLEKRIKEYNMSNEVILAGKITDRELLKSIYYRANLFLFPSLFDASSLVQIEAASQETPTIFVEGSVTSDTVENNFNGFTAPENINSFADRIEEIYKDKKLYNKVQKNAKNTLAKSWETIAKETYDYYLKVIDDYKKNKNF